MGKFLYGMEEKRGRETKGQDWMSLIRGRRRDEVPSPAEKAPLTRSDDLGPGLATTNLLQKLWGRKGAGEAKEGDMTMESPGFQYC